MIIAKEGWRPTPEGETMTIIEIILMQGNSGLEWLLWWHAADVADVSRQVRVAMREAHEGRCEFSY